MNHSLPVIIVSYNTCALLRECLRAVFASERITPRAIVVDNASADGSARMVRAEFPQVQVIDAGENLGFAAANNAAFRALGFGESGARALPEFVALLNPDTVVRPDAMEKLMSYLWQNPQAGAVGAQLLYPDGSFQQSAFRFPGILQTWLDFFPVHHRLMESRLNGRYARSAVPFEIDHPLGACIVARTTAVEQVGLMDPRYFMYVEEVDWCRRMKRAGWQIWCEPRAVIVHHEGQSTRQFREAMMVQLWRSRLLYFAKFEQGLRLRTLRTIIRFGSWRAIRAARNDARLSAAERDARIRAFEQVGVLARGAA